MCTVAHWLPVGGLRAAVLLASLSCSLAWPCNSLHWRSTRSLHRCTISLMMLRMPAHTHASHDLLHPDCSSLILTICGGEQHNVRANSYLFIASSAAAVRHLDWTHTFAQSATALPGFEWTAEDRSELTHLDIIFAADVVYDDDLTDALLECAEGLLRGASKHMTQPWQGGLVFISQSLVALYQRCMGFFVHMSLQACNGLHVVLECSRKQPALWLY